MNYYILGVMLLILSVVTGMQVDNKEAAEVDAMANRVLLIEKAEKSSNPSVIEAGARAEREIQEIKDKDQAAIKEAEYQASLEPYEKPTTWYMLIAAIVGIVGMPFIFMAVKRH